MSFLPPGTRLGNYELIRGVAIGGMAELYLARTVAVESFRRLVALKRIMPHYAASDEFVSMFLDEARLAAKLQHPNIAQVYDIGLCDGGLFFTMELVRGEDVRTVLREAEVRGAHVPLFAALAIVAGACRGLHAAHEQLGSDGEPLGIVHRDVSPSNVIVSFDGGVKLIDFGVAKARCRRSETRDGTIKGKISYMSPEQCRGEPVDRRSDVFALGILLWELTTTRRLFFGKNDFALLKRIVYQDAPRPSSRVRGYPRQLEEIVMRALSRNPSTRYQTADELRRDIEAFARASAMSLAPDQLGAYMRAAFPAAVGHWDEISAGAIDLAALAAADASAREPLAGAPTGLGAQIVTNDLDDAAAHRLGSMSALQAPISPISGAAPRIRWRRHAITAAASVAAAALLAMLAESGGDAPAAGGIPRPAAAAPGPGAGQGPAMPDAARVSPSPDMPRAGAEPAARAEPDPARSRSAAGESRAASGQSAPGDEQGRRLRRDAAARASDDDADSSRDAAREQRNRRDSRAATPAERRRRGQERWDPDSALPP